MNLEKFAYPTIISNGLIKELVINVIEAHDLSYSYDFENPVFQKINFTIKEGEFWGFLGPNGSGKTTLIEMLISMRWTDTGELKILGQPTKTRNRDFLREVSFLSHDVQLNGIQRIEDFLNFHAFFYPNYSIKIQNELLDYFELDPKKKISEHSTGQQKKIQIIAGLAAQTKLIIVDEVTAVLDPETRKKFFDVLTLHCKEYKKTIILATNVVEDLKVCSSKILFIKKGYATIHDPSEINSLFKINDE